MDFRSFWNLSKNQIYDTDECRSKLEDAGTVAQNGGAAEDVGAGGIQEMTKKKKARRGNKGSNRQNPHSHHQRQTVQKQRDADSKGER